MVFSILLFFLFGQSFAKIGEHRILKELEPQIPVVNGTGASFPDRLYQSAIFAYSFVEENFAVSYTSTGSGRGIQEILKDDTDFEFAGSDTVLTEDQNVNNTFQMLPAVAGAVVPIYNFGIDGPDELILSTTVLSEIFSGSITNWNDEAIIKLQKEENKQKLPNKTIRVIVRLDSSGTTDIFKSALSLFNPEFVNVIQDISGSNSWGSFDSDVIKQTKNSGVAGYVKNNEYCIGYSVLGEALSLNLNRVKISRDTGQSAIVEASTTSVQNAVSEIGLSDRDKLTGIILNAKGEQSWPIVGFTYFILRKSHVGKSKAECDIVKATIDFLNWFYVDDLPKKLARDLGFAPLPTSVQVDVVDALRRIECNGEKQYNDPNDVFPHISVYGIPSMSNTFDLMLNTFGFLVENTVVEQYKSVDSAKESLDAVENDTKAIAILHDKAEIAAVASDEKKLVTIPFAAVASGFIYSPCGSGSKTCENNIKFQSVNATYVKLRKVLAGDIKQWDEFAMVPPELSGKEIVVYFPSEENRMPIQSMLNSFEHQLSELTKNDFKEEFKFNFGIHKEIEGSEDVVRSKVYTTPGAMAFNIFTTTVENAAKPLFVGNNEALGIAPKVQSIKQSLEFDETSGALTRSGNGYPFVHTIYAVKMKNLDSTKDRVKTEQTDIEVLPCGNGHAATTFLGWLYTNNLNDQRKRSVASSLEKLGMVSLSDTSLVAEDNKKQFNKTIFQKLESFQCDGRSILVPQEKNLIPDGIIYLGYTLFGISAAVTIAISIWVHTHRHKRIISVASPPFLQQILYGSLISMSTIIPMSLQEEEGADVPDTSKLDFACKIQPFLFSIGFTIVFSALWLKTWRLNKIFNNPRLKNRFITNKRLVAYQSVWMAIVVGLNVYWLLQDPLLYSREPLKGNPLDTGGVCTSNAPLTSYVPLSIALILVIVYGNWLTYQSRHVPSEFGEGKFLAVAMVANLEALLIGIPLLFVAGSSPTGTYLIRMFIIIICNFGTVCIVFIPKIMLAYGIGTVKHSSVMRSVTQETDGTGKMTLNKVQTTGSDLKLNTVFDETFDTEPRNYQDD